MMLAFLVGVRSSSDAAGMFREAREKAGRPLYFWQKLRSLVLDFEIPDWETLYRAIALRFRKPSQIELIDTS